MKNLIENYIKRYPSIGPIATNLKKHNPREYQTIINMTSFLAEDVKFTERLYCIMNDIHEVRRCIITKEKLNFENFNNGYQNKRISIKDIDISKIDVDPLTEDDIQFLKLNVKPENINHFNQNYPELLLKVLKHTEKEFGDAKLIEKIYCVINNINERPPHVFKTFEIGYDLETMRNDVNVEDALEIARKVGSEDFRQGYKIKKFINRNKSRNGDLMDLSDDRDGIDYVTCPILGIRLRTLAKEYITNTLGMDLADFEKNYPQYLPLPFIPEASTKARKDALKREIEPGLTVHAAGRQKAMITNNTPDPITGITPHQQIGISTRATMMQRDENGISGYQKQAASARPNQMKTLAENGDIEELDQTSKEKAYKNICYWFSEPWKKVLREDKVLGINGTEGAYQIDHKYTIKSGFINKLSPFLIARFENLKPLTWEENIKKSSSNSITLEQLLRNTTYSLDKANYEFELFDQAYNELSNGNIITITSLSIYEKMFQLNNINNLYGSLPKYPVV